MRTFIRSAVFAATIALSATSHAQQPTAPTTPAPGYLIANFNIHDPAGFQKYLETVGPMGQKYKLKLVVFNTKSNAVEGSPKSVIVVAEFPSLAEAQRFYFSPEYTAAKQLRIAATEGSVILTEGFVPSK